MTGARGGRPGVVTVAALFLVFAVLVLAFLFSAADALKDAAYYGVGRFFGVVPPRALADLDPCVQRAGPGGIFVGGDAPAADALPRGISRVDERALDAAGKPAAGRPPAVIEQVYAAEHGAGPTIHLFVVHLDPRSRKVVGAKLGPTPAVTGVDLETLLTWGAPTTVKQAGKTTVRTWTYEEQAEPVDVIATSAGDRTRPIEELRWVQRREADR